MLLISLIACQGDLLVASGEFGHLNYTLETSYQMEAIDLNDAKLATGYPQKINVSLTPKGLKVVDFDESYLVYHGSSAEGVTVDSDTLLDGVLGIPSFSIQAETPGSYLVESKKEDELVDQISLAFVAPDEISLLSWIRAPEEEEFTLQDGDNISVTLGSQAAFVPIPMFEGSRIVGDIEVKITVEPEDYAVVGHNIDSVSETAVNHNTSPGSIYFVKDSSTAPSGVVKIIVTDVVNDKTDEQLFTVN